MRHRAANEVRATIRSPEIRQPADPDCAVRNLSRLGGQFVPLSYRLLILCAVVLALGDQKLTVGQEPAATAAEPAADDGGLADSTAAPAASYTGLLIPKIAQRLGLSSAQKLKIEELITERQRLLESATADQATDEAREKIIADNELALAAVLDQRQQEAWRGYWSGQTTEELIRFNFRFQPWADVLNWFAQRADLSLVLDAPPPGTFNYSDNRSYTVPEAIDLLNGVLLTKGYTLLRRERMLLLIELSAGVPEELIPQISLDELDSRGKYELVSVLLPLGERNPEEVDAEIKPLIGPHGKSFLLPKTRQILVTETAGKLRTIKSVLDSIPAGGRPQREDRPREGDKASLASFPLKMITPASALEIFKVLLPDVKVVADANSGQLSAFGTPAQHKAIEEVLAQMQADLPPERKPILENYEIKASELTTIVSVLRAALPQVQMVPDTTRGRLVVWATPADHAKLKETLDQLASETGEDAQPRLATYPLSRPLTSTELTLLSTMAPDGKFTADDAHRRLLVFANAKDQGTVSTALQALLAPEPEEGAPRLEVYTLPEELRTKVTAAVASLTTELAGVRTVATGAPGELTIWARPDQHQLIAALIEQLRTEPPESERKVVISYRPVAVDPANVASVLARLVPTAVVVVDTKTKQLIAFARPQEHEQIRATIEQLDGDAPADNRQQLQSHPVRKADATSVVTVLGTLLPDIRVVNDVKAGAIVAFGRPSDHEVIENAIERMQPTVPEELRPVMKVYTVKGSDPYNLQYLLAPVFPTARFLGDRTTGNLAAWATPEDHEEIASLVEQMQSDLDPEWKRTLSVHNVDPNNVSNILTMVLSMFPTAVVRADTTSGRLIAWARPEEQETISKVVKEMEAGGGEIGDRTLGVYPLDGRDATSLISILQAQFPLLRFVNDARSESIVTWANTKQHEAIRGALNEVQNEMPQEVARTAKVYRLNQTDPSTAYLAITTLFPTMRPAIDSRNSALVVTANEREHAEIQSTLNELDSPQSPDQVAKIEVYELHATDPTNALTTLRTLFAQRPDVRLSLDPKTEKLVAWALPDQHATIREVLEQLEGRFDPAQAPQLEVHSLGAADPTSAYQVLSALVAKMPGAKLVNDGQSGQIAAMGSTQDQATIRATIEQLQANAPELEALPLRVVDPFTAQYSLMRLFGSFRGENRNAPRIDSDSSSQQLFVRGTRQQIDEVKAVLVKMGETHLLASSAAGGSGKRTRTFSMSPRAAAAALSEIERIWPQLRKNPIRVVNPSAVAPTVRKARESVTPNESEPAPAPAPQKDEGARHYRRATLAEADKLLAQVDPAASPEANAPQPENDQTAPSEDPTANAPVEVTPELMEAPPIVIAPGPNGLTISSDDLEALDQFEALLSDVGRQQGGGREFTVIPLRSANAAVVAESLRKFFEDNFYGSSSVSIVPDQRLNALIVRANPNDTATIMNLIEELDASDVPDSALATKPQHIELKHARAEDVAYILRDIYRQPLQRSRNAASSGSMPQGLSREAAFVMEQLRRQEAGPEMTLSVDDATNSIIVMAPQALLTEVLELVHSLDEAAINSAQTVRVVPLKRTKADALERALRSSLRGSSRSRRGGGSSYSSSDSR
jgi:type II secretory pathway component GspD/PulD (secretin)